MRRKEQDRLARMDADYQRRKEMAEFTMRREERMKAAEERTVKSVWKGEGKRRRRRNQMVVEEHRKEESSDDEANSDDGN